MEKKLVSGELLPSISVTVKDLLFSLAIHNESLIVLPKSKYFAFGIQW